MVGDRSWPAVPTVVEILEELAGMAVAQVEHMTAVRKVQALVGSYSLRSCKGVIEVAVDFGHNYECGENEQTLIKLRSHTIGMFEKDVHSGGVKILQRPVQKPVIKNISKEAVQVAAAGDPACRKKHQRKSSKKATMLVRLKEQLEDEDGEIQKFRKRKLLEEESRLEDEQLASQRMNTAGIIEECLEQDGSKQAKFVGSLRYTYDYDGSKIARKEQLPRKGLQALPSIECRQVAKLPTKQPTKLLSKKDLYDQPSTSGYPTNRPVNNLQAKELQEFLEHLNLQEGVNMEGCNNMEMHIPSGCDLGQETSQLIGHPFSKLKDKKTIASFLEENNTSTRVSKTSGIRNSMVVVDGWKQAIEQQFRIGSYKAMAMGDGSLSRTSKAAPLNPVDNYDISILKSHNWGQSISRSHKIANPSKPAHGSVHQSPSIRIVRQRQHKASHSTVQDSFQRSLRRDLRQ